MPKLIILGSSNAIPDQDHENTHMALVGNDGIILIDSVGTPTVRLKQAGLDIHRVTDLILTHFHPDHVSGVPSLLMNMWLLGRKNPIQVHGLAYTLDRLENLMEFYGWTSWPNFYPVNFHRLPEVELAPVLNGGEFAIDASPVRHLVPNIGLRVRVPLTKKTLAYSCDTEPCSQVVRLAEGADVLIHEASGASVGHSSAAQAGEIATRAEASQLLLIHYPTGGFDSKSLINLAATTYHGPVALAKDFMEIEL